MKIALVIILHMLQTQTQKTILICNINTYVTILEIWNLFNHLT